MNGDQTKEMVVDAVKNMPYKGGNTATGRALDYIRTELFTAYNGAREGIYDNNYTSKVT